MKIFLVELRYNQTIFFFAVHSNFTYYSEAYDLMKLYFGILLKILVPSQIKLYTLYSNQRFTQPFVF